MISELTGLLKTSNLPQLYVAVYLNPNDWRQSDDLSDWYFGVKIGSTRTMITSRMLGETGQLSFTKAFEIAAFAFEDDDNCITRSSLIAIENQLREEISQVWNSRYVYSGRWSKENFRVPLSKLEEFVDICLDRMSLISDNVNEFYGKKIPCHYTIKYNEKRKKFLTVDFPKVVPAYQLAQIVFEESSREEAYQALLACDEYVKTTIPEIEIIYKEKQQTIKAVTIPKESTPFDKAPEFYLPPITDKDLSKSLDSWKRKGKAYQSVTAVVKNVQNNRKATKKNFKWTFKILGKEVGDPVWFYDSKSKLKVKCTVCDGDLIKDPSGHIWHKAEFIRTHITLNRNLNNRKTPTVAWKYYFYSDEECKKRFQELMNDYRNKYLTQIISLAVKN